MSLKPTLVFCTLLFFVVIAKAQSNDYVITKKGDTISCKISYDIFGIPKYRISDDASKITIEPKDILEYRDIKNNYLVRAAYREGKNKPEFFYTKLKGRINLYEQRTQQGWYTQKVWYFSKGADTVYQLKSNILGGKSREERKNKLGEMLKDDPIVYQKYISDNKFTFDKIFALVEEYNLSHPFIN